VASGAPLIVNVALTGMVPMPDRAPHVPITTEQILEDVERCARLGASVLHVHARGGDGRPEWRRDAYAPIVEGIREIDPHLVVCATTSGRLEGAIDRRADVLELEGPARADMASLTLGSNNFRDSASVNPPEVIEELARRMRSRGIRPELEAFEPGMVRHGAVLAERGLIAEPAHVNFLLGGSGTAPLTVPSLSAFLAELPAGWSWALGGIGRHQLAANLLAIPLGGHVRVGLEDNIWFDRERKRPASNSDLVERIARAAELAERPLATPAEARRLLGLGEPATANVTARETGPGVVR
jgi:3-keto-5-aminohexanoate cleavage enzyme